MLNVESVLAGSRAAWDSTAMSGTAKRVTEWCKLDERAASVSFQLSWANGAGVAGAFEIEESNDGETPIAAGISSPDVDDNDGEALLTRNTSAKYVRLAYTNTSGTGTLGDCIVTGKSGKLSGEQAVALESATADIGTLEADVATLEADGYTPAEESDWDPVPTTRAGALDQLAARLKTLEDA